MSIFLKRSAFLLFMLIFAAWEGRAQTSTKTVYVKFDTQMLNGRDVLSDNSPTLKPEFFSRLSNLYNLGPFAKPFKTQDADVQSIVSVEVPVEFAEDVVSQLESRAFIEYAEVEPTYSLFLTPNDPQFASQWALPAVNAETAWDISVGSSNVVIAIVDDAVLLNHEDLQPVLFSNPVETVNGVDDDGNGFIDDVNGWDAANNDNDPNPGPGVTSSYFSHGTHVAGIATAATNNNTGMSGMGFGTSLLPVKIGRDSDASLTGALAGVDYAIASGYADVVNMSWGGGPYSATLQTLIDAGHAQGIVFVAAAGNSNTSAPMYPAAYNHVISVAALAPGDTRASFSNYGSTIDISAPGVSIFSAVASGVSGYDIKSGTSMASPLVAGLCGLMKSHNPALTPDEITSCLQSTAVNIDALNPGFGGSLGAGKIDAQAAMACTSLPPIASFTQNVSSICPGEDVTFSSTSSGIAPLSFSWTFPGGSPASSTLANPTVTYNTPGTYDVTLQVSNAFGNDTESRTAAVSVGLPTATLSGTANIVSGGTAYLKVDFTGNPPFDITYTDGTTNTPVTGILDNPFYLPVTPMDSTTYNLVSMNDAQCSGSVSGSGQVNILSGSSSAGSSMAYDLDGGGSLEVHDAVYVDGDQSKYYVGSFDNQAYILKTNDAGSVLWSNRYDHTNLFYDAVAATDNNDLLLLTQENLLHGATSALLITRIDPAGNIVWIRRYGNYRFPKPTLVRGSNSYFVVTRISNADDDIHLQEIDQNGTVVFKQEINSSDDEVMHATFFRDTVTIVGQNTPCDPFLFHMENTTFSGGFIENTGCKVNGRVQRFPNGDLLLISLDRGNGNTPYLSRATSNGSVIWSRTIPYPYTGSNLDKRIKFWTHVRLTLLQDVIILTLSDEVSNGTVMRFDLSGNLIDAHTTDGLSTPYVVKKTNTNAVLFGVNTDNLLVSHEISLSTTPCLLTPASVSVSPKSTNLTSDVFNANSETIIENAETGTNLPQGVSDSTLCSSSTTSCPSGSQNNVTLCQGEGVSLSAGPGSDYTWIPDYALSSTSSRNVVSSALTDTTYFVNYIDTSGCGITDTFTLILRDKPDAVTADSTRVICPGTSANLQASGGTSYAWIPSTGLSNPSLSNPSASPGSTTRYNVVVSNSFGCTDTASTLVEVLACCGSFASIAADDTTVCIGEFVSFSNRSIGATGATYNWVFGPSAVPPSHTGSSPPRVLFSNPGTYLVTLNVNDACGSSTDTLTVYVNDLPRVEAGQDTATCSSAPFTYQLGETEIVGYGYSWSPVTGLSDPTLSNPVASISSSINYVLTISDQFTQCVNTDTVRIISGGQTDSLILPRPEIACIGSVVRLGVGSSWDSIRWSNGQTTPNADYSIEGDTSLFVTVWLDSCSITDNLSINSLAIPELSVDYTDTVCAGSPVIAQVNSNQPIVWNDGNTNFNRTIIVNQDTTLFITSGVAPCTALDTVQILALPAPRVYYADTFQLEPGEALTLDSIGWAREYLWTPSNGLSCDNCANPVVRTNQSEEYLIELNTTDCRAFSRVYIDLQTPNGCIALPTGFTPNGDGINDELQPIPLVGDSLQIDFFRIYNRWGELVFDNPNAAWNGTYKGEPAALGVYIYTVSYTCNGQTLQTSGNVSLIR